MTLNERASAVLPVNRALWDMVTPELRGVCVSWEGRVEARFLYAMQPTEIEHELVDDAETVVMADHGPGVEVRCVAEYLPVHERRELPDGFAWVYLRAARSPTTSLRSSTPATTWCRPPTSPTSGRRPPARACRSSRRSSNSIRRSATRAGTRSRTPWARPSATSASLA